MIKLQYIFCLIMGHSYIEIEHDEYPQRRCMYCGKVDEHAPEAVTVAVNHQH